MGGAAEVVFVNGAVFVADAARSWASAVAVAEGTIVGVGGDRLVDEWVGNSTEVIDLRGRLLAPGFQDAHVHPGHGGWTMATCDLHAASDAEEALGIIAAHAERYDGAWIEGGGWSFSWFPNGTPAATVLDQITPERPAAFRVADGHAVWVNSRALAAAGIDADTPDPVDGRIERLADGRPQGTLHEGAMHLIDHALPPQSESAVERTLLLGQGHLLSRGVTSWQDAWVDEALHRAYLRLDATGRLIGTVRGALWWNRSEGSEQIERLIDHRAEARHGDRYRAETVKLMLDGICENQTASLLEPYAGSEDNHGLDMIDPVALRDHVTQLDARGFQCHFHAIGDAAVRNALDAVASARAANGDLGRRHHIAHMQVVHPDDIDRFRRLAVTANAQPFWACRDAAMIDLTAPVLGETRTARQYPFGALLRAGAQLAMGSDWPVSTANVMKQIAVAVTRSVPGAIDPRPWTPEQRITVADALQAFTAGSAHVNRSDVTGCVAVGRRADLVVLSANPFDIRVADLADVTVDLTLVGGAFQVVGPRRTPVLD